MKTGVPLAERVRPQTLDEVAGQGDAIGVGSALGAVLRDSTAPIPSLVLWGPPGVGKTTIAKLIAASREAHVVFMSGVLDGVKELREVVEQAKLFAKQGKATVVIVDEIHRFNRAQQDAFLPHVESGLLSIVGMTTDNVSFRLRGALLSRLRVITLRPLSEADLIRVIRRALLDSARGLGEFGLEIEDGAEKLIAQLAGGDARRALTALEWAAYYARSQQVSVISREIVEKSFGSQPLPYDAEGDYHYDCVSAFIKSMRGSDPDAALYYMLRALESGEDPLFITRRMIVFASEDAGCDPRALEIAVNVDRAVERIGMPEGKIPMSQAAVYLSCCAKSNASYKALRSMEKIVHDHPEVEIPRRLRNASTELMSELGNAVDYKYPHDYPEGFVPERYLPDELGDVVVYQPTNRGLDAQIKERLDHYRKLIAEVRHRK